MSIAPMKASMNAILRPSLPATGFLVVFVTAKLTQLPASSDTRISVFHRNICVDFCSRRHIDIFLDRKVFVGFLKMLQKQGAKRTVVGGSNDGEERDSKIRIRISCKCLNVESLTAPTKHLVVARCWTVGKVGYCRLIHRLVLFS